LRGVPWARIAEHVGQRDLTVTANTYTHVLSDETEVNYPEAARMNTAVHACAVPGAVPDERKRLSAGRS
jgi:hypothetical protein